MSTPSVGTAQPANQVHNVGDPQPQTATAQGPHDAPFPTSPQIPQFDFSDTLSQSPPTLKTFDQSSPTTSLAPRLSFDSERRLYRNIADYNMNAHQANYMHHANVDPLGAGLHIRTDVPGTQSSIHRTYSYASSADSDTYLRHSASTNSLRLTRTPSIRAAIAATHTSAGSLSPGSMYDSPRLAAMADLTPLPSPITFRKDVWKPGNIRPRSRGSSGASKSEGVTMIARTDSGSSLSPPKRRALHGLKLNLGQADSHAALADVIKQENTGSHARNRSISEYVPDGIAATKPRNIVVSGSHLPPSSSDGAETHPALQREHYLGAQRGLTSPVTGPPTPPKSTQSGYEGEEDERVEEKPIASTADRQTLYTAWSITSGHVKRYKPLRLLGQGTFSKVMLAIRQVDSGDDGVDYTKEGKDIHAVKVRSRRRVAVKIVEHGPAGGADEERMEVSLKREVDILKTVRHPSIVHLRAFASEENRSLLVLNYCPGGDLFEAASMKHDLFTPGLIRRMFAELVSAVRYLHQNWIVHRDIKLENILLNIPTEFLHDVHDWRTEDRPVITLTDLGLSRRIPPPPESPLLQTRCGSEDYAAPEILMGQPYDGRQTDAWALGVVLYALMEGRLPFDALPGARGDPAKLRSRTPHRIARVEWAWYKYGDADGDWDSGKGKDVEGGKLCVEHLLKRTSRRKGLDEIAEMEWVRGGISVAGGLKRIEEEGP